MAVSLSPFAGAGWQFFDNNGVILSGGKLYVYAAGTTSAATTYTSVTGSTANTNPIILNSSGRLANEIWLTTGLNYKFILKTSADVLIGTWDNIPAGTTDVADLQAALASSTGAGMIGYIQGGTAVATTVQAKLRETVSVKDFGADPSATAAVNNAAFVAALAASDNVYIPSGTYNVTGSINIQDKTIYGAGTQSTTIVLTGSNTNTSVFINGGNISTAWGQGGGCNIKNMHIQGNWDGITSNPVTSLSDTGALLKWWAGSYVKVENCVFSNSFGFGVFCYQLGYSFFNGNEITTTNRNGLHLEAPSGSDAITSTSVNYNSIHSCRGRASGDAIGGNAIYLKNGFSTSFYANVVEDVNDGFRLDGNDNRSVSLFYLHSEQATNYDIYYAGSGIDFGIYQSVLGSTNKFYQSNPQYTKYTAVNNFGIEDVYELPMLIDGPHAVSIDSATPKNSIASIPLPLGTWQITGVWNGAQASGLGTASSTQVYALNTSASIPSYSSTLNVAVSYCDITSPVNTFLCGGSLSLTKTISSLNSSTVTISNATPGVVTWSSHGLNNGDRITFATTGALPSPLDSSTYYYVVNKATNTFQVSLTLGGSAVNTTTAGTGTQTCTAYTSIYLYGGPQTISGSLACQIAGSIKAVKINGSYPI